MKMNKKAMEFKTTFFALVIIGILVAAIGIIVNDWGVEYKSGVVSDLGGYDKTGEISEYIHGYQNQTNPQSGETGSTTEDITYRGAYSIIAGIFKPFRVIFSMLDDVFERYGFPDYIKIGIITMILASVVFSIVAIIFRVTRPNI